jgi:hypothetical protein
VAKALNIPEDQVSAALQTGSMPKFGLREAKDEKGKWTNTSGKSMYDQFREIDNLNGQEVLIGIDYEMEKNEELTKKEAAKIVIKNLKKNPIYYTATLMSGVEGYEPEYIGGKSANPEAHQMQYLDKNMSNVVDKKRGMQPVKGIEKPKKDSDARSEINKIIKGVEELTHAAKRAKGIKGVFDMTGGKMKKVSVKESLNDNLRSLIKEIIRKELKETFDGRDNMTDMFGHQIDEVDIYGIAGNPEEEMAAKLAKDSNKYTKFEPVDKVGMRDIELDDMLEDAENNIDWLVKQVGDDAELGAALISRARKTRPSLVPGLKQALNLYNY